MRHLQVLLTTTLLFGLYFSLSQQIFAENNDPDTATIQVRIKNFNSQTYTSSSDFDIEKLYRNFVFYPKYVFDTAQGVFDEALPSQELTGLQTLWKRIREKRGYPTGKNCGRLAFKANFVLKSSRSFQNHVIFLINEHRQVYQWYESGQQPLDDGCICTESLTDNPVVISKDGTFGFSLLPGNDHDQDIANFNHMIADENISLTKIADVIQLADLYLNLTTKAKMITIEYLDEYISLLYEDYANHQEDGGRLPAKPVYELIDIPRVQFTNEQINITFYSWAGAMFAWPREFVRWDITFTRNGEILAEKCTVILE
jgi:hypothetical protein